MRVDCYNACECSLSELFSGDTFYLDGTLYLKAYSQKEILEDCDFIVDLARGEIMLAKRDTMVQKADTKVVAYGD